MENSQVEENQSQPKVKQLKEKISVGLLTSRIVFPMATMSCEQHRIIKRLAKPELSLFFPASTTRKKAQECAPAKKKRAILMIEHTLISASNIESLRSRELPKK